jgi:hypothetical protein
VSELPSPSLGLMALAPEGTDISITTPQPSATPEKTGAQQSAPSASSARPPKSNPANGFSAQSVRTVACDADGNGNGNPPMVHANPLKNNAGTAADGADANLPPPNLGRKNRGGGADGLLPTGRALFAGRAPEIGVAPAAGATVPPGGGGGAPGGTAITTTVDLLVYLAGRCVRGPRVAENRHLQRPTC